MKIENLTSESNASLARVAATVIWEDCDRPTQEIYFETTEAFAQDLTCNPHAFLTACIMPAMRHGEARVFIDAEICPELRNGLITATSLMRHWYGAKRKLVQIEAKTKSLQTPRPPQRAGCFFSGGIDSLTTLRTNRLDFPLTHPGSFKDGLFIYGIERGAEPEYFEQAVTHLSKIAQAADIKLIPVYTNVRYLDQDPTFWGQEFQGAVLCAVAHAFSRRLTTVTIPSSFDINHLYPYGSHPLLDSNYSSNDLQIHHDSILLSRLTKTKIVADWDVALQNLRVCNKKHLIKDGALNCCRCEKCIRTMTGLLALGKLDQAPTFPKTDLDENLLLTSSYIKYPPYAESYYRELMAPLAAKGRHDLVRGIERIIARYHREARLKQIDRQFFQGNLLNLVRAIQRITAQYRREAKLKQIDRPFLKGNLLKFYKKVS